MFAIVAEIRIDDAIVCRNDRKDIPTDSFNAKISARSCCGESTANVFVIAVSDFDRFIDGLKQESTQVNIDID